MFLDRVTTVDVRVTKLVRFGAGRLKGMFDIYNVLNNNTTLAVNTTYGLRWFQPTAIVGGRLLKLSAQIDF